MRLVDPRRLGVHVSLGHLRDSCEPHSRNGGERRVQLHDCFVIELSGKLQFALDLLELALKFDVVLGGCQLWVGLGDGEKPAEGLGQDVVRSGGFFHGRCLTDRRSRIGNRLQGALLEARGSLDCFHEIGNQVGALGQEGVDAAKAPST